jgi:hypothetical protein
LGLSAADAVAAPPVTAIAIIPRTASADAIRRFIPCVLLIAAFPFVPAQPTLAGSVMAAKCHRCD